MIHKTYMGFVAAAAGTVDIITATYSPAPTALRDKMLLWFRATGANTSTTPTFSPNGLTARTIVKQGGQPLVAGDIPASGAIMEVVYDLANTRWELLNPSASSSVAGYLVYTALLTQTGTNAPVATVLENTLGGTVVWSYSNAGSYIGTLAGAFTANKTGIILGLSPNAIVINGTSPTPDFVTLGTWMEDGGTGIFVSADDQLTNTIIEIRVYP